MITKQTYLQRANLCQSPLAKRLLTLMHDKKTNLALSADCTSTKEIVKLAEEIGPQICVLKIHADIINDFNLTFTHTLRELADQHQFLLFEDRKFADIGHTVALQYRGGVHRIADWADIINAHCIAGPGTISGLRNVISEKERGLLLLSSMSSADNLFDSAYQQQTLKMAQQFPQFVMGFITQHAFSHDPQWLNLTPGIKLESGQDSLGQRYITPQDAILKRGTDIIIVGRGIIAHDEPKTQARLYRELAWEAYQKSTLGP